MMARRTRAAFGIGLIAAVALASATPAFGAGGFRTGSLTCGGSRTVVVRSRASQFVYHHYHSGFTGYWTPVLAWEITSTPDHSTWWVVDYDVALTNVDSYCEQ